MTLTHTPLLPYGLVLAIMFLPSFLPSCTLQLTEGGARRMLMS